MSVFGFFAPLLAITVYSTPLIQPDGPPSTRGADSDPPLAERMFLEGCTVALVEANERRYAERSIQAGNDTDYAKAEARFAMAQLKPILEEACTCVVAQVGTYGTVTEAAAAKGAGVMAEVKTRMEALGPEKIAACFDVKKMASLVTSMKAAIEDFKKDYQATHPK